LNKPEAPCCPEGRVSSAVAGLPSMTRAEGGGEEEGEVGAAGADVAAALVEMELFCRPLATAGRRMMGRPRGGLFLGMKKKRSSS